MAASLSFPSVAQQQSTRLITGRPWSVTTLRDHFHFLRWMAQTDERRTEAPQRLARYQLQRPFSRGIDVTASMSVFHTERAGAAPACRIHFKRLRGRLRKAPALKQDHVGANPTGVPPFHSLRSVTAAFLPVTETVPGQDRPREPFSIGVVIRVCDFRRIRGGLWMFGLCSICGPP